MRNIDAETQAIIYFTMSVLSILTSGSTIYPTGAGITGFCKLRGGRESGHFSFFVHKQVAKRILTIRLLT